MITSLQLFLRFLPANESEITFRYSKNTLRIARLSNSLQFMGNMKQLSIAIDAAGQQNCEYELKDKVKGSWILTCKLLSGVVAVEIWVLQNPLNQVCNKVFSWQGMSGEFRESINLMIENAGRYKYFKKN